MKITTKTGDKGLTSLFGGKRVSKADESIHLLGELDELQAFIGFARFSLGEQHLIEEGSAKVSSTSLSENFDPHVPDSTLRSKFSCRLVPGTFAEPSKVMQKIEDDLYRLMAIASFEFMTPKNIEPISEKDVKFLEKEIEAHQENVKLIDEFLRPGNSEASLRMNLARCVCRRVERIFVRFNDDLSDMGKMRDFKLFTCVLKYLNRLSDLLFIYAYLMTGSRK